MAYFDLKKKRPSLRIPMKNLSKHLFNDINTQYFNNINHTSKKLISIILFIFTIFLYTLFRYLIISVAAFNCVFQSNKSCLGKVSNRRISVAISNIVANNSIVDYWNKCMKCSKT